ncbi:actin [Histomonas meleagridis]|nr:actin [Histomonas meleagridis]
MVPVCVQGLGFAGDELPFTLSFPIRGGRPKYVQTNRWWNQNKDTYVGDRSMQHKAVILSLPVPDWNTVPRYQLGRYAKDLAPRILQRVT